MGRPVVGRTAGVVQRQTGRVAAHRSCMPMGFNIEEWCSSAHLHLLVFVQQVRILQQGCTNPSCFTEDQSSGCSGGDAAAPTVCSYRLAQIHSHKLSH